MATLFQKRHYEAIAKAIAVLNDGGTDDERKCILTDFMDNVFSTDNPAFDRVRFFKAIFFHYDDSKNKGN